MPDIAFLVMGSLLVVSLWMLVGDWVYLTTHGGRYKRCVCLGGCDGLPPCPEIHRPLGPGSAHARIRREPPVQSTRPVSIEEPAGMNPTDVCSCCGHQLKDHDQVGGIPVCISPFLRRDTTAPQEGSRANQDLTLWDFLRDGV